MILACALVLAIGTSGALQAQAANPLSAGAKRTYEVMKGYITRAAAKMPEEHYAFKPTLEVRSFGQIVAHIADSQYLFCSGASGQKPPASEVEKTKTSKADLANALADAFAYCESVHAGMTDAAGSATVKFLTGEMAKLSILEFNTLAWVSVGPPGPRRAENGHYVG